MKKNEFKITFTGDIMCDNIKIMEDNNFCGFLSPGLVNLVIF